MEEREKERPQPGTPWEGWLILGRLLGLPDLDEYDPHLEALRDEFEEPLVDCYPDEHGFCDCWEDEEDVAQNSHTRDEPPRDEPLEPLPF